MRLGHRVLRCRTTAAHTLLLWLPSVILMRLVQLKTTMYVIRGDSNDDTTHLECILCSCWTPFVIGWLSFVVTGSCLSAHRRSRQPFDRPYPNFVRSSRKKRDVLFTFELFHVSQVRIVEFKIIASCSNKSFWRFVVSISECGRTRNLISLGVGKCGLPLDYADLIMNSLVQCHETNFVFKWSRLWCWERFEKATKKKTAIVSCLNERIPWMSSRKLHDFGAVFAQLMWFFLQSSFSSRFEVEL
jgi:hypothetical protein